MSTTATSASGQSSCCTPPLPPRRRLAVFDFDGTLCRRNSYHVLIRDRLSRGLRPVVRLTAGLALRRLRVIGSARFKNSVLAELRGWQREQVEQLGRRLYERELRPFLRPLGIAELDRRRAEGFTIVVASGAFGFFLRPFCVENGIEHYVGTEAAFAGETCLGRLKGCELRGEGKCEALRRQFGHILIDWQASCAFTDDSSDLPLLAMVGHGFVVNGFRSVSRSFDPVQCVEW